MFSALWQFWLELDQTLRSTRKSKPHSMDANVQPCAMDASDVQPLADEAEHAIAAERKVDVNSSPNDESYIQQVIKTAQRGIRHYGELRESPTHGQHTAVPMI